MKTMYKTRETSILQLALLLLVALGILALITIPSNFSWQPPLAERGLLKFTVKELTAFEEPDIMLTPEEIERLPFHMRPRSRQDIGGKRLSLSIELVIDNNTVINKVYRPGGVKQDGPLFVYQEVSLDPGDHDLLLTARYARTGEEYIKSQQKIAIKPGEVRVVELDFGKLIIK